MNIIFCSAAGFFKANSVPTGIIPACRTAPATCRGENPSASGQRFRPLQNKAGKQAGMTGLLSVGLLADYLWPVSFRIHNTEETEWFIVRIFQLMGFVWFDVEGIKKADSIFFLTNNTDTVSPDSYDYMFVFMLFETAESIRIDFEISKVKSC